MLDFSMGLIVSGWVGIIILVPLMGANLTLGGFRRNFHHRMKRHGQLMVAVAVCVSLCVLGVVLAGGSLLGSLLS